MATKTLARKPRFSTNGNATADPVTTVVTITPDIAAEMLKRNKHNRRLSDQWIMELASYMEAGEWEQNGEAIKLDEHGNVLDGQHRLHAIVNSGVTIKTSLATGVRRKTFPTLDRNKRRSNSDTLYLNGEKYSALLANAIQWLARYECGAIANRGRSHKLSGNECLAMLKKNPGLRHSAVCGMRLHKLMFPGSACFCHYIFSKVDAESADNFFSILQTGESLTAKSPLYVLREALNDNRGRQEKFESHVAIAMTIKTWNLLRSGTKSINRTQIKWRNDEAFPVPR